VNVIAPTYNSLLAMSSLKTAELGMKKYCEYPE
jgi:hypothetical protein